MDFECSDLISKVLYLSETYRYKPSSDTES